MVAGVSFAPLAQAQGTEPHHVTEPHHAEHKEKQDRKSATETASDTSSDAAFRLMMASSVEEKHHNDTITSEEGLACLRDIAPSSITLTPNAINSLAGSAHDMLSVQGRSSSGRVMCSLSVKPLDVQKTGDSFYVTAKISYMYGARTDSAQNITSFIKTARFTRDAGKVASGEAHPSTLMDVISNKEGRYASVITSAQGHELLPIFLVSPADH